MASKKKTPPIFTENMLYKAWKNKIEMWKLVTSVDKKKQGIIVALDSLSSNGKAEKVVSDLTAADLNVEDGLKAVLKKLDHVFKEETIDEAYNVYSKFINFSIQEEMSMTDYILEFEHLSSKMTQHEMQLPDTVLTFKLLDGANITNEERKLALTLCSDLKFEGTV